MGEYQTQIEKQTSSLASSFLEKKKKETQYFDRRRKEKDTEECQQNMGDVSMIFSEIKKRERE